jgi:hypothetical protein
MSREKIRMDMVIKARVGWVERSETQRHESDGFQRGALLPILLELLAVYLEHDGIGRNLFARCPRSSTTPSASNSGHRVKEWVEGIFFMLGGGESIAMTG